MLLIDSDIIIDGARGDPQAKASVPQRRIDEICTGKRAVTADTAMRLGRLFGMSAQPG